MKRILAAVVVSLLLGCHHSRSAESMVKEQVKSADAMYMQTPVFSDEVKPFLKILEGNAGYFEYHVNDSVQSYQLIMHICKIGAIL